MGDGISFAGGGESDVDMGRNPRTQPGQPAGMGGGPIDSPVSVPGTERIYDKTVPQPGPQPDMSGGADIHFADGI